MFFKVLGAFFIISGGALAGAYKAKTLSDRVCILSGFCEAITVFRDEISFITADMETALKGAAERDKSGIFSECIKSLFEKGAYLSFKDAVSKAVIDGEEKEVMLSFAAGLSGQDKQSQINNAEMALGRIEHIMKKATENKEKKSSLYSRVYLLCSVLCSILLL